MRAKELKPIYRRKGFRNLDELAAAVGVGREHLTNALNRKRGMSRELVERLANELDLRPEDIDPDYRLMVELEPFEWEIVQLLRDVKPPRMRRQIARGIREMLRSQGNFDAA